jgi:hypothetical protein
MGQPEYKDRVETLISTLKTVAGIYQPVSKTGGIVSVKFLNPSKEHGYGYIKITPGGVSKMISQVGFRGLTRIGTELRDRILKKFADVDTIKRPVLVMIFTDGDVIFVAIATPLETILIRFDRFKENPMDFCARLSESQLQLLRTKYPGGGIVSRFNYFLRPKLKLCAVVSYQFVAVGDDPGARKLLDALEYDLNVGHCISCFCTFLHATFSCIHTNDALLDGEDLEEMMIPEKRWHLVSGMQ